MARWLWADTQSSDTYTMPMNPRTMTNPGVKRQAKSTGVDASGRRRVLMDKPTLVPWKFEGRLHSQAEYDALGQWKNKPGRVRITDHIGRVHEFYPTAFEPVPVAKNGTRNAWLFDYTFTGLYVRRIS